MSLANRLPPFVVRFIVWALRKVDNLGLLPKAMIDDDPLFTSLFVANPRVGGPECGLPPSLGVWNLLHVRGDGSLEEAP